MHFLIYSFWLGLIFAETSVVPVTFCQRVWGQAEVKALQANCLITSTGSAEPTLVDWLSLSPGLDSSSLVEFEISSQDFSKIEGLEFRLKERREDSNFIAYKFPLFADPLFNMVYPGVDNKVTLSLLHFSLSTEKTKSKWGFLSLYVQFKNKQIGRLEVKNFKQIKKAPARRGFVSITFDDGYSSLKQADALLKTYNLKASAYIIREALGTPGYVTLEDLCEMSRTRWMIGSHATQPFTEKENLNTFLQDDFSWMKKQCNGRFSPEHLAYPLGKQNSEVEKTVRAIYKTARLAGGGLETLPYPQPFRLRALNVTSTLSPDAIVKAANDAVQNGDWLILMFHYLVSDEKPKNDLEYSLKDFEETLKGLRSVRGRVLTVKDVVKNQE